MKARMKQYPVKFFIICIVLFLNLVMISSSISQTDEVEISFEEIGQIDTPGMARHVVIRDNIAFVTDMGSMTSSYGGLLIYDVSDPTSPTELGHFYDGGRAHELLVEDDFVFVADNEGGLEIINISDLTNPVKIGEFEGVINGVHKDGHLLYLSDYFGGLIILDITNLTHPVEITRYTEVEHPLLRLNVNNLAYVAVETGLDVLDISNPANLTKLASLSYDFHVYDLKIVGNLAYMACSRSIFEPGEGLKILNSSNPLNLTLIGSYYDGGRAIDLILHEEYVIVSDYNDGLEVIDISDRSNPKEIAQYYDGGNATAIQMKDNLIYVADGVDGLEIVKITFTDHTTANTSGFMLHLVLTSLIITIGIIRKINHNIRPHYIR